MAFELSPPARTGPYEYGLTAVFPPKPLSYRITPEEGATWQRTSCALPLPFDVATCPSIAVTKPEPTTTRGLFDPPAVPFGLYSAWKCASVANSQADANQAALKVLNDGRLGFVASTFNVQIAAHPALASLTGGPFNPACALAQVEGYIASLIGKAAYIFAPPGVVSRWASSQVIHAEGGVLKTTLGNVVVVVPDVSGFGPILPIYVTDGAVDVYLSEPKILEDEAAYRLRTINDFIGVVEQLAVIAFDPCFVATLDVDICG